MGSGMPYYHEKGETWLFFDSFFGQNTSSGNRSRLRHKLATLDSLWRPLPTAPPIAPIPPARFTTMGDGATPGVEPAWQAAFHAWVFHGNADWFGRMPPPAGGPATSDDYGPQPPFGVGPNHRLTTGWWKNWYGEDTEEIVRQAFIRAIEVSLALEHPDPASVEAARASLLQGTAVDMISQLYVIHGPGSVTTTPTMVAVEADEPSVLNKFQRNWPIEFWWTCGVAWFQAWVTWAKEEHPASGRVTVTWLTPGSTGHSIRRDFSGAPPPPAPSFMQGTEPKPVGSWIVTHRQNDVVNSASYLPTPSAIWPLPYGLTYSYGDVITFEPAWADGGVPLPAQINGLEPEFKTFV